MKYLVNNYNMTYTKFDENDFEFYHYDENDNENVIDNLNDLNIIISEYNKSEYDDFKILDNIDFNIYKYEGNF